MISIPSKEIIPIPSKGRPVSNESIATKTGKKRQDCSHNDQESFLPVSITNRWL